MDVFLHGAPPSWRQSDTSKLERRLPQCMLSVTTTAVTAMMAHVTPRTILQERFSHMPRCERRLAMVIAHVRIFRNYSVFFVREYGCIELRCQ